MKIYTGIEITPARCHLVAAESLPSTRLHEFRVFAADQAQAELLGLEAALAQLVRDGVFPARARMVVWPSRSIHARLTISPGRRSMRRAAIERARETEGDFATWSDEALVGLAPLEQHPDGSVDVLFAAADRADVEARVSVFRRAGFQIKSVATPALALESLARARSGGPSGTTAYLVLHHDVGALAVVKDGQLLQARPLRWPVAPEPADTRSRLLHRYTFVSAIAPELQHAIAVQAAHGVTIERITLCGSRPELRSLTVPLLDELGRDVEVLDSLEPFDPATLPEPRQQFCDEISALRLAWSVAVEPPSIGLWGAEQTRAAILRKKPALVGALAASVAIIAVSYLAITRPRTPAEDDEARRVSAARPAPPTQPPRPSGAPGAPRQPAAGSTPPAGGPTGRQPVPTPAAPQPSEATPPEGAPPSRAEEPVAPARPEAPAVASILVASSRRLALVDGQIVREGDRIGGFEVIEILEDAVVFRDPTARIVRVPLRGGS